MLNPIVIDLKPEWFKVGYYVYIVSLKYFEQQFFYIGMTGDRKHKTARSPFYRMSGHFSRVGKSTENQIIKGIQDHIKTKDAIEDVLTKMTISYYAYKVIDYDFTQTKNHRENRQFTEQIESYIIQNFWGIKGEQFVFNKKISMKPLQNAKIEGDKILKDLNDRIK